MLGHMQKVNHFWAQIKRNPKCELGSFCPEPFKCNLYNWSPQVKIIIKFKVLSTTAAMSRTLILLLLILKAK